MTTRPTFKAWRGAVGDLLLCWPKVSLHVTARGRIAKVWFRHYEPADKVTFRQIAGQA